MERASTRRHLRFGARPDGHDTLRPARDPVGIGEREARLVRRVLVEIEEAARKLVGSRVVERLAVDGALAVEAQQRQTLAPGRIARTTVLHGHGGVAIGVTLNAPFETERDQRRRLDDERAGSDAIGVSCRRTLSDGNHDGESDEHEHGDATPEIAHGGKDTPAVSAVGCRAR